MSNSGQFITIQRAKEKNKTEHHHLSTSVSYEEEKNSLSGKHHFISLVNIFPASWRRTYRHFRLLFALQP